MTRSILKQLTAGALIAFGAACAQAQPPAQPPMPMHGHGPEGWQHGDKDEGHGRDHGRMMMEHRRLEHMFYVASATPEQRKQIMGILMAAHKDLKTQMEAGRKLHEQGEALFSAPTLDTAAIESLRQQGMAARDAASKRMMQARIDVAKVLTPEQRAKVAADMKKQHERMAERMKEMAARHAEHAEHAAHAASGNN